VLPIAAVGLGIAVWVNSRRRRGRTHDDAFMRERQRAESSAAPEFTGDEKQTLYTGD
jgi:cytochrome c-type biogenesis protein CcmH/NrfF